MITKYEIISKLLFPKFNQPKESRFKDFFSIYKKKQNNKYSIYLEKIEKGEDKRTSVIIKNIPISYTKLNIQEMLNGIGNINYLYLPLDKNTNKNFGFAFVNVVNYKSIINLNKRIKEYKFNSNEFEMNSTMEICYSKIQGKIGLSKMISKK